MRTTSRAQTQEAQEGSLKREVADALELLRREGWFMIERRVGEHTVALLTPPGNAEVSHTEVEQLQRAIGEVLSLGTQAHKYATTGGLPS